MEPFETLEVNPRGMLVIPAGMKIVPTPDQIKRIVDLAVKQEREACAKLAEDWGHDLCRPESIAEAIRERSNPRPLSADESTRL